MRLLQKTLNKITLKRKAKIFYSLSSSALAWKVDGTSRYNLYCKVRINFKGKEFVVCSLGLKRKSVIFIELVTGDVSVVICRFDSDKDNDFKWNKEYSFVASIAKDLIQVFPRLVNEKTVAKKDALRKELA